MAHVSSQDGLLSWGRNLVQKNRSGNPSVSSGYRGTNNTPGGGGGGGTGGRPSSPAASQSSSAMVPSIDARGIASTPQTPGRFADTAVEAEEPHWKRGNGGGGGAASVGGGSVSRGSTGTAAPRQQRTRAQTTLSMQQRQGNNRTPGGTSVSSAAGGGRSSAAAAGRSPTAGNKSPLPAASDRGGGTPVSQIGSIAPPPGTTPVERSVPTILDSVSAIGGGPSSVPPSSISGGAAGGSRLEREKQRLVDALKAEQTKSEDLNQMMERNETAFNERQEELNDVLTQVNMQQNVAMRHPSMESSRAGSPQGGRGGIAPALTAADRKIRSLEEELWNAELALEKTDREEAVCGAAIVRLADCIKQAEDRLGSVPNQLHSAISFARDVQAISLETRNICLRTQSLHFSADVGSLLSPRKTVLPQGKTKLVDLAPLPTDSDLHALTEPETHIESASKALNTFSKSLCLLLDEVNQLRVDRLSGLQEALKIAEAQYDRQCLVIDDAHQTLSDLQGVGARRTEEIEEAKFVLKTLADTRDSTSKRRSELSAVVSQVEMDLQRTTNTHEVQSGETKTFEGETAIANKEKDRALEDSEHLVKERTTLEASARTAKSAADGAEAAKSKLKRELRSLTNQEEDLQREVKGLRERVRNLQEDSSKHDQQRVQLQSELDEYDIELRKLKRGGEELDSEMEDLQRQGNRVDRELKVAKEETSDLTKAVSELKDALDELKQKIREQNQQERDHQEDLELVNLVLTQHKEDEERNGTGGGSAVDHHGSVSVVSGSSVDADASRAALMMSPEIIKPKRGGDYADDLKTLEAAAAVQAQQRSQSFSADTTASSAATGVNGGPGRNVLQVQAAPSHYPPTVDLLPHRGKSGSEGNPQGQQHHSAGRMRRWGPSADREVSEGGTSMSSALSTFYRNKELSPQQYQEQQQQQQQTQAAPRQPTIGAAISGGGGPRAVIDSDHVVTTRAISPDRAPLLVSMQPRHWNRQDQERRAAAGGGGAQGQRPPAGTGGNNGYTGPLSVEDMRARIERYSH